MKDFTSMRGKKILLIIGGGIAAYKSLELIRRLAERGVKSRAILTHAGAEFVTPLSVSALTADKVYSELFSLTDESEMGHIELSRSADLVVVAPATADLMVKLAAGLANDLASTALLATDKKILMAPAMNVRMWQSPSVKRSFETLKRDGVLFVGPNDGEMACGEFGPGRMAEPLEIVAAIEQALGAPGALSGFKALVTAGPTHEPLDPVRFFANRSSGKQGYAIADALAGAGADTVLISGPVEIAPNNKIKKDADHRVPALRLVENPDILASLARHKNRPRLLIGFAAETDELVPNAVAKRARKGADWIVANDVSADRSGGPVMG